MHRCALVYILLFILLSPLGSSNQQKVYQTPMINRVPRSSLRKAHPHHLNRVSSSLTELKERRRLVRVSLQQTSKRAPQIPASTTPPHVSPRRSVAFFRTAFSVVGSCRVAPGRPKYFGTCCELKYTCSDKPVLICLRRVSKIVFLQKTAFDTAEPLIVFEMFFSFLVQSVSHFRSSSTDA